MNENGTEKELYISLHPANRMNGTFKLVRQYAELDEDGLIFNGDIRFREEKTPYCNLRIIVNLCDRDDRIIRKVQANIDGIVIGDRIISFSSLRDMNGKAIVSLNRSVIKKLHYLEVSVLGKANTY